MVYVVNYDVIINTRPFMTSYDIWTMDASTVVRCIYYVHLHIFCMFARSVIDLFAFFLTRSAVQRSFSATYRFCKFHLV